ncbi:leucine-rich_repeat domain-containing protein [Hexamita inflata]|uniref:Leucine-rich repeat domain-containing protein n=1 Tax=Hexamita inflata TaxID=28002 RepID=A0AA86UL78_9EUKA|nr:leucine-rich repeat domain-containing protein [Hexamita inflata]
MIINNQQIASLKFVEELNINQLTLISCHYLQFEEIPNNITNLKINKCCQIPLSGIKQMKQLSTLSLQNSWILNIDEVYGLNLHTLDIYNIRISSIDGLERMKQLKALYLRNNPLGQQLKILQNLTKLQKLDISGTLTTNISGIDVLIELKELILSRNTISDFLPLNSLNNLIKLEVQHNQITDLSFIKHMKQLKILDLSNNQIQSVIDLKFFVNLTILSINDNQIEQITSLSQLKDLRSLNLSDNRIVDITVIQNFIKLTRLNISKNRIIYIDALQNLYFMKLNVSYNMINDFSPIRFRPFNNKIYNQQRFTYELQIQAQYIKCINGSYLIAVKQVQHKRALLQYNILFKLKIAEQQNKFCQTILTFQNCVLQYLSQENAFQ